MSTGPWDKLAPNGEVRDPEIDDITASERDEKIVRETVKHRRYFAEEQARRQQEQAYQQRRLDRIESAITGAFEKHGINIVWPGMTLALRDMISELFPDEPFHR